MGGPADLLANSVGGVFQTLADFSDATISFLLRPFGIYDRNETFSDIQILDLLTPGVADKSARKNAKYHAMGDAMTYFRGYRGFQRQYRKKYSKKFIENLGYSPSSTATTRIIDNSKVQTYVQTTYSYGAVNITRAKDIYLNLIEKANYGKQAVGFSTDTGILISSGKNYTYSYAEDVDPTSVMLHFVWKYQDNILDNLTTNYSYNSVDNTVLINDRLYSVGTISGAINGSNQYETTCSNISEEYINSVITASSTGGLNATVEYPDDTNTDGIVLVRELATPSTLRLHIVLNPSAIAGDTLTITVDGNDTNVVLDSTMISNGYYDTTTSTYTTGMTTLLPDEIIYTDVVSLDVPYSNSLFDNEVTYIVYTVTSGEVGTGTRYTIAQSDTLDIYNYASVDITAIVPMKENNVIVDLGNNNLVRMLKRLNLSGEQLKNTLENPDMDGAYLMTGINLEVFTPEHNKVLFQMFDLMSNGSGNVSISISELSMRYGFSITKSTKSGIIGTIGNYYRVDTNVSTPIGKDLDGNTTYADYGQITLRYQGSSTEYQEIVINNFIQVYTISGQTLNAYYVYNGDNSKIRLVIPLDILNSLKYKEWVVIYESSLCMLGFATKTILVKWYETAAFGSILQIVGFVLMVWSVGTSSVWYQALLRIFIGIAIAKLAVALGEAIGGDVGLVVAAIFTVVAMYFTGMYDNSSGSQLWLQMANDGLSTTQQIIQHEVERISAGTESMIEEAQRKIEELEKKIKDGEDITEYQFSELMNTALPGTPNTIFQTIEQYVSSIINTEWLVDGDWMYNIEKQINLRNQVYVGN